MRSVAEILRSYAVFNCDGIHVNGCDKMSNHNYGSAYERIIADHLGVSMMSGRHRTELMMEIGVADGSSLLAWREIFPNALCVGFDIEPSAQAFGQRIEFHLGDATKRDDCDRVAQNRLFDMIVDDATHHLKDLLRTLLYMWRYVRPGGLYVIEEFEDIQSLREQVTELFPFATIVGTCGPHIQDEPLVVLKKPMR